MTLDSIAIVYKTVVIIFKIDRLEQHLKDVRRETRKEKETMVNTAYGLTTPAIKHMYLIYTFLINHKASINFRFITLD